MKKMYDKEYELKSRRICLIIGAAVISLAILIANFSQSGTVKHSDGAVVRAITKGNPEYCPQRVVATVSESNFVSGIEPTSKAEILAPAYAKIEAKSSYFDLSIEDTLSETEPLALVFDPSDVRVSSNITEEQLHLYCERYCEGFVGYEHQLLEYDAQLNLIFLLAVGRMETWGGDECTGVNNCFNTRDFYTLEYVDYADCGESIQHFVDLILNNYLSEDGLWWSGGYSVANIGMHYADVSWAEGITDLAEEIKWLLENRLDEWREAGLSENDDA